LKPQTFRRAALAAALLTAAPSAIAAAPSAPLAASVQVQSLPASAAVAAFYNARGNAPIWFKSAATSQAAHELVGILRRAQLDGLASGPMLAQSAEAAIAKARSGDPAAVAAAERLLSSAWVLYVQTVSRPSPVMAYSERYLMPRVPQPELVLLKAAQAPSLAQHLRSEAQVNAVYAELRDAPWNQLQQTPGAAVDPRVLANLERARALPGSGRYVMVDAASARLFMVEDGRIRDSMKVIVGKPETRTPLVASTIYYATFNPYWHVPDGLARRIIAPGVLRSGIGYLKSNGYEVVNNFEDAEALDPKSVDWKAVAAGRTTVKVRQKPGPRNSMGDVKFHFANSDGVYLHDTPQKELFAESQRTLSNGCIRLEDADRLSRWLLGREPQPASQPEQHVQLPRGVPIYITYLTAQADGGSLTFARDVYGHDAAGGAAVAAR
jgi:murein L,D-transpeptidase YcbB/YkuD